MPSLQQDT